MNPKRLIEEWLPIKEIGVESRRERAASSALPPLYFLHVWWARRPLTASRASILGSLLPAWEGNGELLGKHFADEEEYRRWFLRMLGVPVGQPGVDPVATAEAILRARDTGRNLGPEPLRIFQGLQQDCRPRRHGDLPIATGSLRTRYANDAHGPDVRRRLNTLRGYQVRSTHPRKRTEPRGLP